MDKNGSDAAAVGCGVRMICGSGFKSLRAASRSWRRLAADAWAGGTDGGVAVLPPAVLREGLRCRRSSAGGRRAGSGRHRRPISSMRRALQRRKGPYPSFSDTLFLLNRFRNRTAIPRASPTSNRFGRSSDLLLFRSLPGTQGQWLRYSEFCGASQQRDCPGFSPDSLFILAPVGASEPNLREQI